ncbi:hypothetical protein [Desulfonema magnum]|uniref:Uncharacterized protein n=1 Tax=Desulfonema magnum TaxID=45655 RepID=A0A975GRR8_9BACT|nr:hypothetical protein [Desulfonema magnum]QTA91346.1 Uncharacterized protein dnm_074110 [Desulfonema magnum]
MNIRRNLKPGQKGTKKLAEIYGDSLVCVRYRYDEKRKKRLKTVEIIIDEADWEPQKKKSVTDTLIVGIRTELKETKLRSKVRNAGGKWDRTRKLWVISYTKAAGPGLEDRIAEVIVS